MKRKTKSILSIMLALFMVMTLFIGCAQTNKSNEDTSVNTDNTHKTDEDGEEVTEDGVVKNEQAEEIVLFYPWANNSTTEGIEEVKAAIEEKLKDTVNIKLNWIIIPRDNFEEKLNTMLVSGERLDGGIGDGDDFWEMNAREGLVLPIDDLLDRYGKNLKEKIPEVAWQAATNSKGEITGIPNYSRNYWQGAIIRKDWLDELGLEIPDTLEEIEEGLEAFKQKDTDIIPASGASWYMEAFLMSAVTGNVTPELGWEKIGPDGSIIQSFCHPEYKKFLKLYNKWIDNGWFNKDFLVTNDQQNDQMFVSGKVGLLFTDPHNIERYHSIMKESDPDTELAWLPVPSGPAGGPAFKLENGVSRYVWISQTSPSPERVVQYFDWLLSDQGNYMLARFGIEGKYYLMQDDEWALPEDAAGDPNKRQYYDVFAPLEYEFITPDRVDEPDIVKEINKYYASLPVVVPDLYGFIADWNAIEKELGGPVNFIDIWGEMYNVAVGARPFSDWEVIVNDYMTEDAKKAYEIMTEQYLGWKEKVESKQDEGTQEASADEGDN